MAVFPQGLAQIDNRCNAGERLVLRQLKRCLEDDYWVWHNVPVGPRARQPDFVVLSPRRGVLLLEVKHWRRGTVVSGTRDAVELQVERGRVTEPHPLRQARDYAMELVELMQQDQGLMHTDGPFRGKLLFPYGWGVALSNWRRDDVAGTDFASIFPESRTLLRDDLLDEVQPADFQQRLWGMFTVHYPCTLTLPQRDRIRWHLFPEIRMPSQAALDLGSDGSNDAPALDLLQVMDLQQEQIARSLGEGHRVIHGVAGSGKTMILVFRAQFLAAAARPDRPVLVLCYNRALADRLRAMLRLRGADGRVVVRTFHAWCQDMVRTYQLETPEGQGDEYFQRLAGLIDRAVASGRVPGGQYTAVLVDEAHDFEDAWLRIAARMVNEDTRSLLVLYDDAQSIYREHRRRFNFASVGIEARGRTSVLKLNYRNTAEVLALAMRCARHVLADASATAGDDEVPLVAPTSAGRHGALPVLIEARHQREEAELIAQRAAEAHAGGVPLSDIAVLCRNRSIMSPIERALLQRGLTMQSMGVERSRHFDWKMPSIKILTMHSAKGLEFPLVFVVGLQALSSPRESFDDEMRLLYVAMTRATQTLVLSAAGKSPIVESVREAIAEIRSASARAVA